ncbi:MAG: hypothetical protein IPK08_07725 [Bacteroidetes bacterium]|nr:hypothetical protein [Bacteroidota bacterium]
MWSEGSKVDGTFTFGGIPIWRDGWGVFPIFKGISWESTFVGAFAGILFAIVYRKEGPQQKMNGKKKEMMMLMIGRTPIGKFPLHR